MGQPGGDQWAEIRELNSTASACSDEGRRVKGSMTQLDSVSSTPTAAPTRVEPYSALSCRIQFLLEAVGEFLPSLSHLVFVLLIVDAGADLRRASDTLIDLGQALCLCVAAIVVRLLCIAAWCPFFAHVIITPPLSRFYADAHLVHTLTYVYIGSVQRGKKQGVA